MRCLILITLFTDIADLLLLLSPLKWGLLFEFHFNCLIDNAEISYLLTFFLLQYENYIRNIVSIYVEYYLDVVLVGVVRTEWLKRKITCKNYNYFCDFSFNFIVWKYMDGNKLNTYCTRCSLCVMMSRSCGFSCVITFTVSFSSFLLLFRKELVAKLFPSFGIYSSGACTLVLAENRNYMNLKNRHMQLVV